MREKIGTRENWDKGSSHEMSSTWLTPLDWKFDWTGRVVREVECT